MPNDVLIDDPWLLGYRDGSDSAPKRLLEDKEEYEAGYEVGARQARIQALVLGREKTEPSIFDFSLLLR